MLIKNTRGIPGTSYLPDRILSLDENKDLKIAGRENTVDYFENTLRTQNPLHCSVEFLRSKLRH